MKDTLKQRLAMTTGAAAAALGPVVAQGAIVYKNTTPITATFNTPDNSHDWDVDGGGQLDFTLAGERFFYGYPSITSYAVATADVRLNPNAGGRGFLKTGGRPEQFRRLSEGVAIGPTLAAGYGWGSSGASALRQVVFGSTSTSTLASSTEMYGRLDGEIRTVFQGGQFGDNLIGFRFDISGAMHYGWAELFVENGNPGDPSDVTITRWAFEDTADCAINAGQTSGDNCAPTGVPNPGTLALLAAGAAGLRRWRGNAKAA